MKKSLIIASLLAATLSSGAVLADSDYDRKSGYDKKGQHSHMHHARKGGKEMMNREFTADQIRTLNEARLIMQDNPNLKVGKVTSTKTGYDVTIVTKDDSLVETKQLAKNGMSLKAYEQAQERIAKREQAQKKHQEQRQEKK